MGMTAALTAAFCLYGIHGSSFTSNTNSDTATINNSAGRLHGHVQLDNIRQLFEGHDRGSYKRDSTPPALNKMMRLVVVDPYQPTVRRFM